MTAWRLRSARMTALVVTAVVPLTIWPGAMRPFSTPKLWLMLCASLAVLATAWLAALPAIWLASWIAPSLFGEVVSLEALATAIAGGLWAVALLAAGPRARDLAIALAVGGSGVAMVGLMQWSGHDPFIAAGWLPQIEGASVRMRVYATLGNPNFVAGLLVGTVPLTAAVAGTIQDRTYRLFAYAAAALQLAAIAATGSRAGVLGIVAAAVAWSIVTHVGRALLSRRGLPYGGIAVVTAALLVAAATALQSEGRPLRQTLAGRIYIWNIVSMQAWAHPWVGYGPGGVEAHYLEWERAGRTRGVGRTFARQFAGPQQHAHNDYLEALVERGIPGLATLFLMVAAPVIYAARLGPRHQMNRLTPGAASAIAGLAAVAAVDYPLSRPGELLVFWAAVVILTIAAAEDQAPASLRHGPPSPLSGRLSDPTKQCWSDGPLPRTVR